MTAVDVLLVNYLTGGLARTAVAAVSGPDVHLHVWDNSGELMREPPEGVDVMGRGRNILYARANNVLYGQGSAPFVLLLNPDVVLSYDGLRALCVALERDPAAWGATPALRNADGTPQNYRRRLPTLRALLADRFPPLRLALGRSYRAYICSDDPWDKSGTVEQPAAACLLLRRSACGAQLFDDQYPLFFNDTDLARRLAEHGHCLYVSSVVATHVAGASVARVRVRHARWVRRQYDDSLLRYARHNVKGWVALVPIIALRRLFALCPHPPGDLSPELAA